MLPEFHGSLIGIVGEFLDQSDVAKWLMVWRESWADVPSGLFAAAIEGPSRGYASSNESISTIEIFQVAAATGHEFVHDQIDTLVHQLADRGMWDILKHMNTQDLYRKEVILRSTKYVTPLTVSDWCNRGYPIHEEFLLDAINHGGHGYALSEICDSITDWSVSGVMEVVGLPAAELVCPRIPQWICSMVVDEYVTGRMNYDDLVHFTGDSFNPKQLRSAIATNQLDLACFILSRILNIDFLHPHTGRMRFLNINPNLDKRIHKIIHNKNQAEILTHFIQTRRDRERNGQL